MLSEVHEVFRRMIDETLAGEAGSEKEETLCQHLQSCAQCQEYFSAGTRVIAGLSGYSFELDPALQSKGCVLIRQRAQQIEATRPSRRRTALILIAAIIFAAGGSFLDLLFGSLIASALGIQRTQIQQEVLAFWIVPSLSLLILFPLLPLLSAASANRQERIQ